VSTIAPSEEPGAVAGSRINRGTTAVRCAIRRIALCLSILVLVSIAALFLMEGPGMKELGENRTITSRDGTRIAFSKLGAGPALVLVDGAFCYRQNGPAPDLVPLLARDFTVFSYDRRGRGESRDTMPYAIEREIDDLAAIIDQAGGSAFVFGISSGAALALQAAASGVNITKMALYEPPYIMEGERPRNLEAAIVQLQALVTDGDRSGAVRYFMTDVFGAPKTFVAVMPLLMPRAWRRNKTVASTLPYDLTLLSDWSVLRERRASIRVPTLVLGGAKSPAGLQAAVQTVAAAIPNARQRLLAGQSHMISAKVLAPVLQQFFRSPDGKDAR
jgi:pimeloyl-ACP methyl ester carboxylesterase